MSQLRRVLAGGIAVGSVAAAYVGLAGGGNATASDHARAHPIVIAHRGASEYRPEETLSAYKLAISMGADYIEPDVVSTKDHVLVARHENALSQTTDVASHSEFQDRKKTKTIDGTAVTDWFTEDFTFAELRTLRAKERIPDIRPDNTVFDGQDQIPSLEEVIKLARENNVGVYPETKHPTYFTSIGLPLEVELLSLLAKYGLDKKDSKVFIQSFEPDSLEKMRPKTKANLIQLIDSAGKPYDFVVSQDPRTYDDLVKPQGLRWLSSFANGIGPSTTRIVPVDATGHLGQPTTLIRDAHRNHLKVHPYTIRPENNFLPVDFRQGNPNSPNFKRAEGNATGWLTLLFKLGVDGVFSDDSALAVSTRTHLYGS